jgi:hypothetical protein
MTIKLTAEHVQRAIEDYRLGGLCRSCPVYQALKDAGVPVKEVYHEEALLSSENYAHLSDEALLITAKPSAEWPSIQPCEFEINWEPK